MIGSRTDSEVGPSGARLSVAEIILRFLFGVQFGLPIADIVVGASRSGVGSIRFVVLVAGIVVIIVPIDVMMLTSHRLRRSDPKRFPWAGGVLYTLMTGIPLLY